MGILKDLMKIEFITVRSRILGFWGIYFTLGLLISLFWFKSLSTQETNVNSFLQLGLEADALEIILHTPSYPLLFTFCVTLLGPVLILLFTDMIPTEIASGQLLVLKTSGTDLQKIYNVRIIIILLSILIPHLILWLIIHVLTIINLTSGSIILYDALLLSMLQYALFALVILIFYAFCLVLTFVLSTVLENQVTAAFLAIFLLLVLEIVQPILDDQKIPYSLSISATFSNLFYSAFSPTSKNPIPIFSASNSYAFIGLIGLLSLVIGMAFVFNLVIRNKEVY